ncbi:rhomboid family intramembrane serine protease [Pelagicoccus enzymogenes]|uniref:rhomboid family intramembrane serine protease n=1 Tax=Pelagicoccus enzymogenes TaxID=2773457 RepID=UPI00280F849C|nr:rhomboid family intramembrane serine protease [Pelagicoccus enzymogenes]MDQ8200759.1 rhomboid family intramembrane serine protease [Pelagicoccus enzymogenes]
MEEETEDEKLAIIGSYASARMAHEAGLSVLACGQPYWVRIVEGRYLLVVLGEDARRLKREVDETEAKNRFWPPRGLDLSAPSTAKWPTAGLVGLLVVMFALQNEFPALADAGLNSREGLIAGEWWRVLTAVSLHADVGHLAGNLMGLSLFAYLSCRYMGSGLAWTLVLLSAGLANLSNALLRASESFSSLGASTAVFAALGLLAGYPVGSYLRARVEIQTRDWLVPFFGGCVAFAWMGGGEFPTDVAGHVWSFGYGSLFGAVAAWSGLSKRLGKVAQGGLLALVGLGLLLSWLLALGTI